MMGCAVVGSMYSTVVHADLHVNYGTLLRRWSHPIVNNILTSPSPGSSDNNRSLSRLFLRSTQTAVSSFEFLKLFCPHFDMRHVFAWVLSFIKWKGHWFKETLDLINKAGAFRLVNESHTWFLPTFTLLDTSFDFSSCPRSRRKQQAQWLRQDERQVTFLYFKNVMFTAAVSKWANILCLKVKNSQSKPEFTQIEKCSCSHQQVAMTLSDRWRNCTGVSGHEGIPTLL